MTELALNKEVNLIGVFDSGIGGLTVFKELHRVLPDTSLIYLGDTARVPYGTKSKETVIRYSSEASKFLMSKGVDLIVIACNTSSALAIDVLRERFDIPVIGVIEAGAKRACSMTKTGRIGVIGTQATIKSGAYGNEIRRILPSAEVISHACPLFVPLAEEGWTDNDIARQISVIYLDDMKKADVDTLILGCTHYPLLKRTIGDVMGRAVRLVDSAESVADGVKKSLSSSPALRGRPVEPRFYVTDSTERFQEVGSRFLGYEICSPEIVDITGD